MDSVCQDTSWLVVAAGAILLLSSFGAVPSSEVADMRREKEPLVDIVSRQQCVSRKHFELTDRQTDRQTDTD